MRRVVLLAEAAEDLQAAHDFYEGIQPSLGLHFMDALLADLRSLSRSHRIHSAHFGCHRKLATYFPFGICYLESETETTVVAILNLHREPGPIQKESRAHGG